MKYYLFLQKILDALKRVTQNRTTIVIAHRLSTVVDADHILVLDKGRVVEEGTHFDLLSMPDSLYSDLWTKQHEAVLDQLENESNSKDSEEKER